MKNLLITLTLILAFATPAGAADWLKFGRANNVTTGLSSGEWATNTPAADENSTMLNVGGCENFDLLYFKDTDDGGAGVATINVFSCAYSTDAGGTGVPPTDAGFNSAGVCWIIENATLDGVSANNLEAIYAAAAQWIYVDLAASYTATPHVYVKCNGPAR